jgi:hypothetical protein
MRRMVHWLLLCLRRALSGRRQKFVAIQSDPVFGTLEWEGYGNGDWWFGTVDHAGKPVTFRIYGVRQPDLDCVTRAHRLVADMAGLRAELASLQRSELRRQPLDAQTLRQLTIRAVVVFPYRESEAPDGYSGDFVILQPRNGSGLPWHEWRCDLVDGQLGNLRRW